MKNVFLSSRAIGIACIASTLSACAVAPANGPSTRGIKQAVSDESNSAGIKVIEVTDAVARRLLASKQQDMFSENLGEGQAIGSTIGKGDVLEIAIWEAPPAALFGALGGDPRLSSSGATARGTSLPEQMVDSDGRIVIPFVGNVQAAGRTPQAIAREITARLAGRCTWW